MLGHQHYHPLSLIITHYHSLSRILTHHHPSSPIITHHHSSSLIITHRCSDSHESDDIAIRKELAAKIYRDEGVGALFRGAGYNAIRAICSALTLAVSGEVKAGMKRRAKKA